MATCPQDPSSAEVHSGGSVGWITVQQGQAHLELKSNRKTLQEQGGQFLKCVWKSNQYTLPHGPEKKHICSHRTSTGRTQTYIKHLLKAYGSQLPISMHCTKFCCCFSENNASILWALVDTLIHSHHFCMIYCIHGEHTCQWDRERQRKTASK